MAFGCRAKIIRATNSHDAHIAEFPQVEAIVGPETKILPEAKAATKTKTSHEAKSKATTKTDAEKRTIDNEKSWLFG